MVDLLKRASLGCLMAPVLITGGELQHREQGYFTVPKRDLVVALALACWGGTKNYPGDGDASAGYAQRDGEQSWERDMRRAVKKLVGGGR